MEEINLLENLNKVTTIIYDGPSLSLNSFYVGGHFSNRLRVKNKFKAIFQEIFKNDKDIRFMKKFYLSMKFNNRIDTDNQSGLIKVFVDTLKEDGYIEDDNKAFFKGMSIFYNPELEKNTVQIDLYEIIDDEE